MAVKLGGGAAAPAYLVDPATGAPYAATGGGGGGGGDASAANQATQITAEQAIQALITALSKAEDAAHASGDQGLMLLAVRKDTAAALAGTDGDYAPFEVDKDGRLHVIARQASNAAAAANVHAPASNTAAVVTYAAAGAGVSNVIGGVAWSYSAAPTSGNLKIEDGSGTTVFSLDITSAGPGFIPFAVPMKGTANTALIITLAAGGSGVTGKANSLGKWTE